MTELNPLSCQITKIEYHNKENVNGVSNFEIDEISYLVSNRSTARFKEGRFLTAKPQVYLRCHEIAGSLDCEEERLESPPLSYWVKSCSVNNTETEKAVEHEIEEVAGAEHTIDRPVQMAGHMVTENVQLRHATRGRSSGGVIGEQNSGVIETDSRSDTLTSYTTEYLIILIPIIFRVIEDRLCRNATKDHWLKTFIAVFALAALIYAVRKHLGFDY